MCQSHLDEDMLSLYLSCDEEYVRLFLWDAMDSRRDLPAWNWVSFSVAEVLAPVGVLVLVSTASLLPVGKLRTGSSFSSVETGELSGCWAWVG